MELIYLYYLVVFYWGAILGSFLNVVALDIQKLFKENDLENRNELFFFTKHVRRHYFWRSLFQRRSHCDSCGKILNTFELFPIFSYLLQRGRCTGCGSRIDASHVWLEVASGLYFLGIFHVLFWQSEIFSPAFLGTLFFWSLVFGLLFVVAVFDYRTQVIPDILLLSTAVLTVVYLVFTTQDWLFHVGAAVVMAGLFYALWWFSRGQWIGLADGKLAGVIGLLLGFSQGFTALAFAFWVGAFVCLVLLGVTRVGRWSKYSLSWHQAVPFGPCLVFGLWYVFVTGTNLFQLTIY